MYRVRSLSNTAHAIECGNSDAGSEVAIRTSAHSGLFKLPTNFFCDLLSLAVQRRDSGGTLHGHAVDAAGDLKLAALVESLKRSYAPVHCGSLPRALDAHIDEFNAQIRQVLAGPFDH